MIVVTSGTVAWMSSVSNLCRHFLWGLTLKTTIVPESTYLERIVVGQVRLHNVNVGPALELLGDPLLGGRLVADEAHDEVVGVLGDVLEEGPLEAKC